MCRHVLHTVVVATPTCAIGSVIPTCAEAPIVSDSKHACFSQ